MMPDQRGFWFGNNPLLQNYAIIYVLKWSFLGITTGIIAGLGVAVFLKLLAWSIDTWTQVGYYYFFIPVVLMVNSWLVNWLAPQVSGGSDKVIAAIHQQNGFLRLSEVPIKIAATVITIAAGGSAGKEGPAAQIGATLASAWARFLQVSNADCRKIAICGLSAGFAGVFGTPVAGAIFGVEVLFVGKILYDTLYPAFVAGLAGYYICRLAGVSYFYLQVNVQSEFLLIIQAIILGLICGIMAIFFIKTIFWNQRFFKGLQWSRPVKAFVGGSMLTLIGYVVSPLYLGLGLELLETGLKGQAIAGDAFFWKILATGITLACGGTGGIITPILVVGAVTGNLYGQLFGTLDISVYAVIGMAALLAGAVNTPMAAVFMAAELFGSDIIPYAAISCLVSYLVSEHRSVYPSQVIATGKRPYLCDDEGKCVGAAGKH
jgi:H+/Cl- antiporter ClcA